MTDKAIKELVPSLLKKYRYCQLCCSNEKYNEIKEVYYVDIKKNGYNF